MYTGPIHSQQQNVAINYTTNECCVMRPSQRAWQYTGLHGHMHIILTHDKLSTNYREDVGGRHTICLQC